MHEKESIHDFFLLRVTIIKKFKNFFFFRSPFCYATGNEFTCAHAYGRRIQNSVTKFCWKRKLAKEAEKTLQKLLFSSCFESNWGAKCFENTVGMDDWELSEDKLELNLWMCGNFCRLNSHMKKFYKKKFSIPLSLKPYRLCFHQHLGADSQLET